MSKSKQSKLGKKLEKLEKKAVRLENKKNIHLFKAEKRSKKTPLKDRKLILKKQEIKTPKLLRKVVKKESIHATLPTIKGKKMKMGERNYTQRAFYGAIVRPKNLAKSVIEGQAMAVDEIGSDVKKLKANIDKKLIKPFIRKRTKFGFDRQQYKQAKHEKKAHKLETKEKRTKAKAEYIKISNEISASNPISKFRAKRKLKKRIYEKHGLKTRSQRIISSLGSQLKKVNPVHIIQNRIQALIRAISAFASGFTAIVTNILFIGGFFTIVIIPVIVIVNIFSIFFNFDGNQNVEVAKMNIAWSKKISDLSQNLKKVTRTNSCINATNFKCEFDEIDRIILDDTSLQLNGLQEAKHQVELSGYLSAMYQDSLTSNIVARELDSFFKMHYQVKQRLEIEEVCTSKEDPATKEIKKVCNDFRVLYLSLKKPLFDDISAYVDQKISGLDLDKRELAQVQMKNYRDNLGLAQFVKNPFGKGVSWKNLITSPLGYRDNPVNPGAQDLHTGLDIAASFNTPLYAGIDGEIVVADEGHPIEGGRVYIKGKNPTGKGEVFIRYLHQSHIAVHVGQKVTAGELIGYVGSTGSSTGSHLHIQINLRDPNGLLMNPLFLIEE